MNSQLMLLADLRTAFVSFLRASKWKYLPRIYRYVPAEFSVVQPLRRYILRLLGVVTADVTIGKNVLFENFNVAFKTGCVIGDNVSFVGLGRINIGKDVQIGSGSVFSTQIFVDGHVDEVGIHYGILVTDQTDVPAGEEVFPSRVYGENA